MQDKTFWEKCVALGVVIVPFMAHKEWDGPGHVQAGIRFVGIEFDANASIDPGTFWLELETGSTHLDLVAETPELALEAFERYLEQRAADPMRYRHNPGNQQ